MNYIQFCISLGIQYCTVLYMYIACWLVVPILVNALENGRSLDVRT
jgi:hypothetical protein